VVWAMAGALVARIDGEGEDVLRGKVRHNYQRDTLENRRSVLSYLVPTVDCCC
jgi:hypothetical protein